MVNLVFVTLLILTFLSGIFSFETRRIHHLFLAKSSVHAQRRELHSFLPLLDQRGSCSCAQHTICLVRELNHDIFFLLNSILYQPSNDYHFLGAATNGK